MSMSMKTAIAAALFLGVGAANAQTSIDTALATYSGEADLVFQGTVTGIEYANSVEGIPHTFVTYRVEEVVKGSYSAPTLTLRFIGGIKKDGKVIRRLSVSHAPRFESGQQDLLMVKGNGTEQCPLVKCSEGRFRFEQGIVKTEHGEVLAREPRGGILTLRDADEPVAPGDTGARELSTQAAVIATPFDRASFVAHVRELVGQQAGARAATQVRSADPSKAFKGPDPAVAPPPGEPRAQAASKAITAPSEHDRLEAEAFARNGGNPVLPAKDVETLRRLRTAPPKAAR